MHWTVTTQHKDFFQENHSILFDELITLESLIALKEEIRHEVQKLGLTAFSMSGKDFTQKIASLNKFSLNKQWAKIFAELLMLKHLRYGYTQLIYPQKTSSLSLNKNLKVAARQNIQEISSIQGCLGGVIFCLDESFHEELPKPGSALFFDKEYPIPFDLLKDVDQGMFLMIIYCEKNSVYIHNDKDKETTYLRTFGYNYGDRLLDKLNPLVYQASSHN
jgi:hypothetical protein